MKNTFFLILMTVAFILGSISISFAGSGFSVISNTGSHNTGEFIPANEGNVTVISQPEIEEKPLIDQDSEKEPEQKSTITITDSKKDTKMNRRAYKRQKRKLKKSSISLQ